MVAPTELALLQSPAVLPPWIVHLNLIEILLHYVMTAFLISIFLRLRFYHSIYRLTEYVMTQCPRIYALIDRHKFGFLDRGTILLCGANVIIFLIYFLLIRVFCQGCSMTLAKLAEINPSILVWHLLLAGCMLALDGALIAQVSVIQEQRILDDLRFAEGWLGGKTNQLLENALGKWNPISWFANKQAKESVQWLSELFRYSMTLMIVQLAIRFLLVTSLFTTWMVCDPVTNAQNSGHPVALAAKENPTNP